MGSVVRAYVVVAVAGACALLAGPVAAQTSGATQTDHSARVAALGGAGTADVITADARSLNPALLAAAPELWVGAGYAQAAVIDVVGFRAGVAGRPVGRLGALSLDVRYREVRDLIDDPELADEPGLRVADWGARVGYATAFFDGRVMLGASAEQMRSVVFGTKGRGWDVNLGAAVRLAEPVSLGVALVHLGPSYRWTGLAGEQRRTPLGRAAIAGIRAAPIRHRYVALSLVVDGQLAADRRAGDRAVRAGGELRLARVLALRGGYEWVRTGAGARERRPAAGLGLALPRFRLDIARDRIGAEVGERTLLELTFSR
jgi:hypothetical protein